MFALHVIHTPVTVVQRFLITALFIALCCSLLPRSLLAAPTQQIVNIRGPLLQGELPYRYTAHYFGLEVNERDGMIALTLVHEPQNVPNLLGLINFMVLDEDGLRRFSAGEDPDSLQLAQGNPVDFDPIGNKQSVAFRAVGRGNYTVIVYNNSTTAIRYTLVAEGATLIDSANQSLAAAAEAGANALDTIQDELPDSSDGTTPPPPNPLGVAVASRLSGVLDNTIGRHYLSVAPNIRNGTLIFNFHYDPLDQPALHGNVNFWILDQAGLNAIIRGDKPSEVNLGTGFPAPFSPFPNDLQASFNASGRNEYTAVLFNRTAIPATYEMVVEGGALIDRYGQSFEAKAAAITSDPTPTPVPTPTTLPTPTAVLAVSGRSDLANAAPFGVEAVAGNFTQPYQHHYLALAPTVRNGFITLRMTFDPQDKQTLRENINFLVLTEEGLRAVTSGGRPVDYDIATGSYGRFGIDPNQRWVSFQASGHGKYTVIVYNNSEVAAQYRLSAEGGLLSTEDVNVSLP